MTCSICGVSPIETDGKCASCRSRERKEQRQSAKDALKKPAKIAKFSVKKAEKVKPYAILRRRYLNEHPVCEAHLHGCTGNSEEIHHLSESELDFLEVSTWMAICRHDHNIIERGMSAEERRAKGFLIDPVNKKFEEPHKI